MIVNHLDLIKLWPPCHPHQGRHKGWQRDHRFSPVLLELRKYSIGVILSSVSSGEEEENKGILLGKGSQEEKRTKSGLLPNQGGVGVSEGSKKTKVFQKQNSILENNFQWACRIILGPPKHVVHLVWLFFCISANYSNANIFKLSVSFYRTHVHMGSDHWVAIAVTHLFYPSWWS